MNPHRWRKMTWVLYIWSGAFLVWIVAGVANIVSKSCSDVVGSVFAGDATCADIALRGKATVATDFAFTRLLLWVLGVGVLALVWSLTREKKRMCPHCGEDVEKGVTACKKCGYDFVLGKNPAHDSAPVPVASTPPKNWYDDPDRPGHTRWWDGAAWGVRDDEHPSVVGLASQEREPQPSP